MRIFPAPVIFALLVGVACGQCVRRPDGSWSCPGVNAGEAIGGNRLLVGPPLETPWRPVQPSPTAQGRSGYSAKRDSNVVTVRGDNNSGTYNGFVAAKIKDTAFVVTGSHCVRGGSNYTVRFANDTMVEAVLLETNGQIDSALLACTDTRDERTHVVFADGVSQGQWVQWIAYRYPSQWGEPIDRPPRILAFSPGSVRQVTPANFHYSTTHPPQGGNSGGPIINKQGLVCGIISEVAPSDAISPHGYLIKQWVDEVLLRQTRSEQGETVMEACDPVQPAPPLPEPDAPEDWEPAPAPPAPVVDLDLQNIVETHTAQITKLDKRVTTLEHAPAPYLLQGKKGDKGDPGTAPSITEIIAAMEPLTVNFLDGDGNVSHSQTVPASGGVINMPPQWLRTYKQDGTAYSDTTAALGWPVGLDGKILKKEGTQNAR